VTFNDPNWLSVYTVVIQLGKNKVTQVRQVTTLIDFISDVGGFIGLFMSFGSVLFQFYTPKLFKAAIVKASKMVDITKELQTPNLLTKANFPENVTIGDQDLFEIITQFKNYRDLKLNDGYVLFKQTLLGLRILCHCKSSKITRETELMEKGISQIESHLDILSIIRAQEDI
jgi:hypothetical protein